ncbi:MAG: Glucokinase, ROK family, partial [Caldanaerobacter subterraneus]
RILYLKTVKNGGIKMGRILCGVDLGGTKISTGLVDEKGNIIRSTKIPTMAEKGPEEVIKRIEQSVYDVLKEAGLKLSDLKGVGIGSPGPLDAKRGVVISPPNLPGWDNVPIVDILSHKLGVKVKLENDANAAAIGEHLFGAGKGIDNFVYITVSTGIGGGVIIEGKLYSGENSNAAEIGHHTINFNGPRCNCGNYGCFEAFASGTAIARFAQEGIQNGKDTMIRDLAKDGVVKSEHVFEAAKLGDEFAKELVDNEAFYLGVGISNIMAFYNPKKIAIGGGVSTQWDMLYDKMMETIKKKALKPNAEVCEVVRAELGENVGVLGAAALLL